MNKLGVTAATAALLLLLAGCSSTPAPAEPVATTPDAVATTEPTATPEPLVASTEAAAPSGDDAQYLNEVRQRIQQLPDATDEQLIASGHQSCDLFAQGQSKFDQRLIEGETPDVNGIYPDSVTIATWAATVYCPEFS